MGGTIRAGVAASPRRAGRPLGPGVMSGVLCTVLLALLGAVALTTRQDPPPAIAELSPQAVEQIKEAPSDQASASGRGGPGTGGAGPGGEGECPPDVECDGPAPVGVTTTTTVPPPPIIVPNVRRCVGDPPRQIEDPQSPPCVPYWDPKKDNGGATSKGVTRDEIRIAVPEGLDLGFQEFFNKRFEFYGRKLRLLQVPGCCGPDNASQQNAAVAADKDLGGVFASTHQNNGGGVAYARELARRGVVSVMDRPQFTAADMQASDPFLWQYAMSQDGTLGSIGAWLCARLAGRNATHSGDIQVQQRKRIFAIDMQVEEPDQQISSEPLDRELAACGEKSAATHFRVGAFDQADATNEILELKSKNVSSVICICNTFRLADLFKAATANSYFPEWIVTTYSDNDVEQTIRNLGTSSPDQLSHLMGLGFRPRQIRPDREPSIWALREINPACCPASTYSTIYGTNLFYRDMLVLASGIQMAGPNLTPETFRTALQATKFPNPEHPNRPGKVGFAGGSHAMTTDAVEYWWDNAGVSPYGTTGAFCYVEDGVRRRRGEWPRNDPFFSGPCQSGA